MLSLGFTLSETDGAREYVYPAWSLSFDMQMESSQRMSDVPVWMC